MRSLQLGLLVVLLACAQAPAVSSAVRDAATDEVTTIALREAIERALRDARRGSELEVICARVRTGDPTAEVMSALTESMTRALPLMVLPASACRVERTESSAFDRAQVVASESGQRGMEIFAESLVFVSSRSFSIRIGFFQHPVVSGQWVCAGRKIERGWVVDRCDEE